MFYSPSQFSFPPPHSTQPAFAFILKKMIVIKQMVKIRLDVNTFYRTSLVKSMYSAYLQGTTAGNNHRQKKKKSTMKIILLVIIKRPQLLLRLCCHSVCFENQLTKVHSWGRNNFLACNRQPRKIQKVDIRTVRYVLGDALIYFI